MSGGSVLVTGASSGIGWACALDLDAAGFRVFAGVRRDEDAAHLRAHASSNLTPVRLDVTDRDSIRSTTLRIDDQVGDRGLAGLVNNAGIAVAGAVELVPLESLRQQLEVNVLGQVSVTRSCLPLLRRARGRVVNMGSVSGLVAYPWLGAYAASKFALEALSDALRLEVRDFGVQVCLLEPGSVATPIWEKAEHQVDEFQSSAPSELMALYAPLAEAARRKALEFAAQGVSTTEVARAVRHALTTPRPRARYRVGRRTWQPLLARLLPSSWRDALFRRMLGLESAAPRVAAPGGYR